MKPAFITICIATASPVLAQDVGDQIVVVADEAELKSGREVTGTVPLGNILTVDEVNADWFWVKWQHPEQGTLKGWVNRRDVVRFEDSLEFFNNQIRRNPSAAMYSLRGEIWRQRDELDIALEDHNQAIRLDSSDPDHWNNRGLTWRDKGEFDRAISDFSEAIRLAPDYIWPYRNRAYERGRKGEFDDAIADYSQVIRLDPDDAHAYNMRGVAWRFKGEYENAIADYTEAIRLDPEAALFYYNRGWAWNARGEYDIAIADYTDAIRIDPEYVRAYHVRGVAWHNKKDYEKAIADYTEAIRLDSQVVNLFHDRAIAWSYSGKYGNAIADYTEALRIDPDHSDSLNKMAWIMAVCVMEEHRNGERAVEYATKACDLTDWQNAGHLDTLAAACAETGDFDEAIEWQRKAIDLASDSQREAFTARLELYQSGMPYRQQPPD